MEEFSEDLRARPVSEPLVFGGTVGLFEAACGAPADIAVLFARAWGIEEMCSHRFFRVMAERFADRGIASLRFDYPGTGDALEAEAADLSIWADSLVAAATVLKQKSGCEKIVIVAQGLGAIVADRVAGRIAGLEAAALLAPVVSGRAHVRELAAFFNVSNEKLRLNAEADAAEIAAILLPPPVAEDLRKTDLMKGERAMAADILVFTRQDRPSDSQYAGHLRTLGADVAEHAFEGYDRLTFNPLVAEVPQTVVTQLVDWIGARAGKRQAGPEDAKVLRLSPPTPRSHAGHGYSETPVRFGPGERLYGVVCAPLGEIAADMPRVLLLAAGYERMAGWGGATARTARALARNGVASLRFDCSNVADSPPVEGHEGQVLYTDMQVVDVQEALTFLQSAGQVPVVAAGLCSGAYLAYQTAVRDTRIGAMVGINPEVFVWPENRSVDDALKGQIQTLEHYGRRIFEFQSLKKALRGEVNLLRKGWEIGARLKQHVLRPLSKAVGGLSGRERAVYAGFGALETRNMPVSLLYSVGDIGLEEFAHFFGSATERNHRFPNVVVTLVPEANHTFMQKHARSAYVDLITKSVRQLN